MGLIEKRKTYFLLAFMVIIFLLKINHLRAAFMVKSNTSYECNGHLDKCWTTEAFDSELEWELDMVMNSSIVRMLESGSATITGNTVNSNEPSQKIGRSLHTIVVFPPQAVKQTVRECTAARAAAKAQKVHQFSSSMP
ncbi:hypothetical protein CXB51_016339 [Gossypium anomalum]|uniref:Uncharacterized protein n=1 Tax=Gossypium anomalum TaxID=47600 RepID=A0A8J5ZHF6_9ROSI|nr:hypothetical protein CXB51_016339 [Gossypium anomalum]